MLFYEACVPGMENFCICVCACVCLGLRFVYAWKGVELGISVSFFFPPGDVCLCPAFGVGFDVCMSVQVFVYILQTVFWVRGGRREGNRCLIPPWMHSPRWLTHPTILVQLWAVVEPPTKTPRRPLSTFLWPGGLSYRLSSQK